MRLHRAPGIFVAFEASPRKIVTNGATFDRWLAGLPDKKLFVMNAHLSPALVKAGDFDVADMPAMLAAREREIGAQWIVFDGSDVLLTLLQDPTAETRELCHLRDRLADGALTAVAMAQAEPGASPAEHFGLPQLMVDCVVRLARRRDERISAQTPQITTYRGSGYAAAEFLLSFYRGGCRQTAQHRPQGIDRAPERRRRAARRDAGRRGVPRRQHADHRRSRHVEDHAGRQVHRGRLRARRARAVREFRRERRADHAQPFVGGQPTQAARLVG